MDLKIPAKPKLLQFETNTDCNGHCTFCRHSTMKKRPPMPLHQIVDLLYHLAHRVTEVFPFGMQEPLLEPRLLSILSNVKLFNPRGTTTLYTNMSRYPPATLKKIIKGGLVDTVMVSFYGGNKQVHDKMQPGTPYARTKRHIKQFVKLRDRLRWVRPKIYLAYLITPESLPQLRKVIKEWSPILPVAVFRWDSWCGYFHYDQEWEEDFWGEPGERKACSQLWEGLYVNSQGDLLPCCMDVDAEMKVGNVFEDWNAWWNSKALNELRLAHMRGEWDQYAMCKACSKWRRNEEIGRWVEKWQEKELVTSAMIQ